MRTPPIRIVKRLAPALLVACLGIAAALAADALDRSTKFQLLGEMIDRAETEEPVVALTFDDGPDPANTRQLLDALSRHQVKATFFLIGERAERHPELVRLILAHGHEVGNHTYTHTFRRFERPSVIREEIERTDAVLRRSGAAGEINFRAPYGRKLIVLPYVLSRMGKRNVMWDVNPRDYENPGAEVLAARVAAEARPGSIVLLHDRAHTTAALDRVVAALRGRGYSFKTVAELINRPGG